MLKLWLNDLRNNKHVWIIVTDLSKVFDSIYHGVLIHKLDKMGVSMDTIELIENLLANRSVNGKLRNMRRKKHQVRRGFPQDPRLRSIIFYLYIAEISSRDIVNTMISQKA